MPNSMRVGVPRESKQSEGRVGLTPSGVRRLSEAGIEVRVEADAGQQSGFANSDYATAGAVMVSAGEAWQADLIVKVKEPVGHELSYLRAGQMLFCYLHLAADLTLASRILESRCIAIAYETVCDVDGGLPLLTPMSEIAGALAPQVASEYLQLHRGGPGTLMGGAPGVAPAQVTIVGGGTVGSSAARIALGLGAVVTVVDARVDRLRELAGRHPTITTISNSDINAVRESLYRSDVIIGAALSAGARAPTILTRRELRKLRRGCLLIDVAIDQGGCFETSTPTTHSDPTYVIDGITHYCVTNMPGVVARTATQALTAAALSYVEHLATGGPSLAIERIPGLLSGFNAIDGKVTCRAVADQFGLTFTDPRDLLAAHAGGATFV